MMSKWTPLYSCLKNEAAVSSPGRGRQGVVLVFVWLLSTVLVRSGPQPRSWIWEPSPDSRLVWLRARPWLHTPITWLHTLLGPGLSLPPHPLMWDLSRHSPALGDLKHVLDDSDSWQLLRSPGPGEDAVHWG